MRISVGAEGCWDLSTLSPCTIAISLSLPASLSHISEYWRLEVMSQIVRWNAYENCLLEHKVWELIRFQRDVLLLVMLTSHLSLNLLKTMGKSKDSSIHTIRIFWAAYSSYYRVVHCRYADTFLYLHPPYSFRCREQAQMLPFFWLLAIQLTTSITIFVFEKPQKEDYAPLYNPDIILHKN